MRRFPLELRRVPLIAATVTCLGLFACSTALAKTPTGDFAGFTQCPRFTPGVELCIVAPVDAGEVRVGRLGVPISKTLTLQGGIIVNQKTFTDTFVEALNGQTFSRTPLPVSGGLAGIVNPGSLPTSMQRTYGQATASGGTAVSVTTELVATPMVSISKLENKEGTGLSLPIRIKLENQLLGSGCYIGTPANPIIFNLTTGETRPPRPNMPIKGKFGRISSKDEFNFIEVSGDSLVDNAFSVPAATGCGGTLAPLLDPAIDSKLGLPAFAGTSAAILDDTIHEATTLGVIESER